MSPAPTLQFLPLSFARLLRQLPPDTIVDDSPDDAITAAQMADLLDARDSAGLSWLQDVLAMFCAALEGVATDGDVQPVDEQLVELARISDFTPMQQLLQVELFDGAVVLCHPELGNVTKEQLLADLPQHGAITVAYGAAVFSIFRELLAEEEEDEDESAAAGLEA